MATVAFELFTNLAQLKEVMGDGEIVAEFVTMETIMPDLTAQMTAKNTEVVSGYLDNIRAGLEKCVSRMKSQGLAFCDETQTCLDAFNALTVEDALA
jgi:hypothetical protein